MSKNIVLKKASLLFELGDQLYVFCQVDIGTAVEFKQITQYLKQLSKDLDD